MSLFLTNHGISSLIGYFFTRNFLNGGDRYGAFGRDIFLIVWFQNLAPFDNLFSLSLKSFPIAALRDLISQLVSLIAYHLLI